MTAFLAALLRRLAPLAPLALEAGVPAACPQTSARPGHCLDLRGADGGPIGRLDLSLPVAQALGRLLTRGELAPVELRPLLAVEEIALEVLAVTVLSDLAEASEAVATRDHAPLAMPCASATLRVGSATGFVRLALDADAWARIAPRAQGLAAPPDDPLVVELARLAALEEPLQPGDLVLPAGWGAARPERAALRRGADTLGEVTLGWEPPRLRWSPSGDQAPLGPEAPVATPPQDIVVALRFEGLLAADVDTPVASEPWVREGAGDWHPGEWVTFEGRLGVRLAPRR